LAEWAPKRPDIGQLIILADISFSRTIRKEEKREKIWEIRSGGEMLFKQQSKGTQEIMACG